MPGDLQADCGACAYLALLAKLLLPLLALLPFLLLSFLLGMPAVQQKGDIQRVDSGMCEWCSYVLKLQTLMAISLPSASSAERWCAKAKCRA